MSIENISIIWNTIAIDITYNDDYCQAHREIMGHSMAHLKIKSRDNVQMPISKTGFRSQFIAAIIIEEYGGAEKYVVDWMNEKSKSKEWQRSKQLTLF